jgi:CRISPR-associated protein Csm5
MAKSYKLTCLTPTLIGDGQELSPIDYMVWKDQVNVLDQRRIFKLFAKGPRLDGYLAQIKRSDRLDFASWGGLAQNYAGRRIAFSDPSLTRYFEKASPQDLFIRTFASTAANGIYVPGTVVKGALRTGAMFAGLTADHWKRVLDQVSTADRIPRRLAGPTEDKAVRGLLKGVMAGDSEPVAAAASTAVYLLRTATLAAVPGANGKYELAWKQFRGSTRNAADSMPVFVEMAKPGTVFSGSWKGGPASLAAARKFARDILASHVRYCEAVTGLAKTREAAQTLLTTLDGLGENQCLVPLGWGAGFLGKAAVADAAPDHVRDVLRKLPFYTRALQTGMPFPKTRRIVFLGDQPSTLPGWALLEV